MTDQELRALVRDAVARHLGQRAPAVAARPAPLAALAGAATIHPSHAIYLSVVNTTEACVIEPSVPCNHCNYCKSHGH
jgi:hypothetical protein